MPDLALYLGAKLYSLRFQAEHEAARQPDTEQIQISLQKVQQNDEDIIQAHL
jgi:hypothetical protein